MELESVDGQDHGQGENIPPEGDFTEGTGEHPTGQETAPSSGEWQNTVEARMDLMAQGLEKLNATLSSIGQSQMSAQQMQQVAEDVIDDGEPLTPSKINKIVGKAVRQATDQTMKQSEVKQWDAKAKADFPFKDPRFMSEFNRQWTEFKDAGGDPNSSKAIYHVAQVTAKLTGGAKPSKAQASKVTGDDSAEVGEVPTMTSSSARKSASRRSSQSKIPDDDKRVEFYRMREDDPKKIEEFKQRLEEKDRLHAKMDERRRRRRG